MRGDIRGWMAIGVIGLAVLAAILIGQQKPDSPEHSTNSDAANGASAVMLYASAMGHPTHQVTGSFEISDANTMLFVFTPTSPYTSQEADATARFLADLLGLVPAGAPVVFDEYHHGLTASDITPAAWILTPWGAALLWLIVAIFFGLLLRGRRFGPLVPRPAEASRLDAEWAVAVGELLRRAGARAVTLGVLARASERAVAMQTGLPVEPRERFWRSLWQRAPDIASDLDSAERALYGSEKSEKDLLAAAQRLHRIAYPVSEERRRRPRQ